MIRVIIVFIMLGASLTLANIGEAKKKWSPEERLTRKKCTSCHVLPKQGKHTEAQLTPILQNHKNRIQLTEEERLKIIKFLKQSSL